METPTSNLLSYLTEQLSFCYILMKGGFVKGEEVAQGVAAVSSPTSPDLLRQCSSWKTSHTVAYFPHSQLKTESMLKISILLLSWKWCVTHSLKILAGKLFQFFSLYFFFPVDNAHWQKSIK